MAQQPVPFNIPDSLKLSPAIASGFCANDIMLDRLRKDPVYKAKEDKMNNEILNASRTLIPDTIYLPVVFHIINPNPASITDIQILNGLNDLNDAFGKTGAYSASLGADTKIRFCIAQNDPDGGNSTGITRTETFYSTNLNMDNEDGRLKNLVQWDPSRYINIWLVSNIRGEAYAEFTCGSWFRLGVGGYATMPPGGGSLDGIVISGFGKVLAHEMGHYLGLYHTFEGGCNNFDCLLNGDRVCDTPPDGTVHSSAGCASPTNTCNTDTLSSYSNGFFPFDAPDPIANFMDYGNGACSNEFTQGQADRMRAAIITQRSGLLVDECTKPCIENSIAVFTRDVADPVIGDLITFTNNSTGAINYQWLLDGTVVATTASFSYSFIATGKYKLTLKAYNSDINCFASYTDFIIVRCGVTARFFTDKKTIASRIPNYPDSIVFTNTSVNAVSYQWLMSNNMGMSEQVVSTNANMTYVFPTPGNYRVRLIATDGSCIDTSEFYTVPVLEPTVDGAPFNVNIQCFQQDKIRVSFCVGNFGYESLPKNTPVSFYDSDPRLPGARKLSPDFYVPNTIPGVCRNCYTQVLDTAYRGVEKIYIVVNDSGTTSPLAFPNTPVQEINYFNNIASVSTNRSFVNVAICQGSSYRGYSTAVSFVDTLISITGCDSLVTTNLTINPLPQPNLGADQGLCSGDTLVLNPGNFTNYLWQDGSTNPSYAVGKLGVYLVTVSNGPGCSASDTIQLTKIFPLPAKFLPNDTVICDGYTLQLKIPGYNNYNWNTGSNSNSIDITKAGVYALQVIDNNGCTGTDTINVDIKDCIPIQVPSGFTPNNDGKNETFKPLIPVTVTNYHMQIFNRWGERVFETRNPAQGWNGTLASVIQPPDVYVYLIVFTGPDGINYKRKGTLALIR